MFIHCRSTISVRHYVYGDKILPYHQAPVRYTGELFGIQYLYKQSLPELALSDCDGEEDEVDEGLGDERLSFLLHPSLKICQLSQ